ncbi:hypothetical protein M23134_08189 [Microscilla marina ATCC 23134]|uniref:Uncharacterized protein n=2 Tax=Microscilla marina TaxID=1027 RepID=A1ZH91_MICM2|nr:hypothetical protein M23134_08189 [Microscilla marina ATCC 23134]
MVLLTKNCNFAAQNIRTTTMKIRNIIAGLLLVVCFQGKPLANAAMPGFWDVGAGINFIPFFAKDSVHLDKIQMQSELVTIMLYPGFAVVKGEYQMYNHSDAAINLTTGYPINSGFMNKAAYSVQMSDLYGLQVKIDGKNATVKRASSANVEAYHHKTLDHTDNWYIWEAAYAPQKVTQLTVYFIVNTNTAQLRKGYNADYHNGFSYLLESGRAWAKNIGKGRIYVHLMDTLKVQSVQGVYPFKTFKTDGNQQMVYDFADLEPTENSNVVIRYSKKLDNFDFNKVLQTAQGYFKKIDALKGDMLNTAEWKTVQATDFNIYSKNGGILVIFPLIMAYLIPILIVAFAVIMWYKYKRKKARQ